MKTISFLISLLGIVFLLGSCHNNTDPVDPVNPDPAELICENVNNPCDLVKANNHFGFKLLKKLNDEDNSKNIFISPTSIATALSMTMNGAADQTLEDMMNTLELEGWTLDEINAAYKTLLRLYPILDDQVKLEIANSIWYKENYVILESFLNVNTEVFNSQLEEVDFHAPETLDQINDWVSDNTHGLIETILDQMPSGVVMILINAIYFKGDWLRSFDPENTFDAEFNLADGGSVPVEMMVHSEIQMPYLNEEKFQAVNLAYGDSIFSMVAMLPKADFTTDDIINDLSADNWNNWMAAMADETVNISLPKFEMEYEKKLNDILKEMGMAIAFTDSADFSNINGTGGLRIDLVKHKSFIKTDEVGTEAAAVTVVVIVETSVPQIPTLNFNKPWVFVIRDNVSNSVLFVGKMMNPTE